MEVIFDVDGCDDTTRSLVDVTEEELKTLIRIGKINNKNSRYQCQPTISIFKDFEKIHYDEDDEERYEIDCEKDLVKEEE